MMTVATQAVRALGLATEANGFAAHALGNGVLQQFRRINARRPTRLTDPRKAKALIRDRDSGMTWEQVEDKHGLRLASGMTAWRNYHRFASYFRFAS